MSNPPQAPTTPKSLYKILPTAPPTPLPNTLALSTLDATDGFIHLSTGAQVSGTASRFFADQRVLWVARVEVESFGAGTGNGEIVWEAAGEYGVFPHLYSGALGVGVIREVLRFERVEGRGWDFVLGGLV